MLFPGPRSASISIQQHGYTHLIAEIGLNHNGSVELAKKSILQSVLSGASLIKLQKRTPDELSTVEMLDSPFLKCPAFGVTQRQVRDRLEFSKEEFVALSDYTDSLGAQLFTSVFDISSLKWALDCGVSIIKIASHSNTNLSLLREVALNNCSTIMSTGAASLSEVDKAVSLLIDKCQLSLMHCVSAYPTPNSETFLSTIPFYSDRYQLPVGFSSHESGIVHSIAACALGAPLIERHVTLNKSMEGLDHGISLDFSEFAQLRMSLNQLRGVFEVKKKVLKSESPARNGYHVGIYSTRAIAAGERLVVGENVMLRQPAGDPELFLTGLCLCNELTTVSSIEVGSHISRSMVKSQ